MGYTFPEKLFASVAEFVAANPLEVVTLVLLGTHGNAFPSEEAVVERLNSTGLLQFVYNFDPVTGKQVDLADNYPTLRPQPHRLQDFLTQQELSPPTLVRLFAPADLFS